jgi:glycogen debranching enzyme
MAAGTGGNISLKENYTFLVTGRDGAVRGGEHGLYDRDTRFLSKYAWEFPPEFEPLLVHSPRPDLLVSRHAAFENFAQTVGIRRELAIRAGALLDTVTVENTAAESGTVTLTLELGSDFSDVFEVRSFYREPRTPIRMAEEAGAFVFRYAASDGLVQEAAVRTSRMPDRVSDGRLEFRAALGPGGAFRVSIETALTNPAGEVPAEETGEAREAGETDRAELPSAGLPSYEGWRSSFAFERFPAGRRAVIARAADDLRALLLSTPQGPFPAAGIPWYSAAFGRDGILTAYMLLPYRTDTAYGVLRYLAAHRGRTHSEFRAEAPGKIMHELRFGELVRTGKAPHGPYYGTLDATPLFVVLLHETWKRTGDTGLIEELRPDWEAALEWMTGDGDPDRDGFLEYRGAEPGPGKGCVVQTWKDSEDSMSHADGSLAHGLIAPVEVQGYAYRAFLAAGGLFRAIGEPDRAEEWIRRAEELASAFDRRFRLPGLGTYAMALDGEKRPLRVLSSNPGHLLWSGIVPEEFAPELVRTLLADALWSGWGVRTLGNGERRYNPLSYHNGSVWPHDNAIIAEGLLGYGFRREAAAIRDALFELAFTQPDLRLPELVGGYPRTDEPPVPYPTACRPQAWDAAALLHLAALLPD